MLDRFVQGLIITALILIIACAIVALFKEKPKEPKRHVVNIYSCCGDEPCEVKEAPFGYVNGKKVYLKTMTVQMPKEESK